MEAVRRAAIFNLLQSLRRVARRRGLDRAEVRCNTTHNCGKPIRMHTSNGGAASGCLGAHTHTATTPRQVGREFREEEIGGLEEFRIEGRVGVL